MLSDGGDADGAGRDEDGVLGNEGHGEQREKIDVMTNLGYLATLCFVWLISETIISMILWLVADCSHERDKCAAREPGRCRKAADAFAKGPACPSLCSQTYGPPHIYPGKSFRLR